MNRRQFLATSGATAIAAATPTVFAQTGSADARFRAMLDRFFYERLESSPESATRLGLDTGPRAALRGTSQQATDGISGKLLDEWSARLRKQGYLVIPAASMHGNRSKD